MALSAYAFLLYGPKCEQYFLGTAIVAWSLIKHLCRHNRVLLYTPDIPTKVLELARHLGIFHELIKVEYIEASPIFFDNPQAHRRFGNIFTKYRVFGLTRYEKVLFLDADLHIRGNIDNLFDLPAPAAMARGPQKPPMGNLLQARAPVNAGVMLLKPDLDLLDRTIKEICGEKPKKLRAYNSPDADYLTEHVFLGSFSSIPLEYNYQLEFEQLDVQHGIVHFSQKREEHFSDAGKEMPWADVRIVHFSGAKPWPSILQEVAPLFHVKAAATSPPALGDKLSKAIIEYAKEAASFQGLCSQLHLGEGLLWHERSITQRTMSFPCEQVRGLLEGELPVKGHWYEGIRPSSAVWIHPCEAAKLDNSPFGRKAPVGAYLEIAFQKVRKPRLYDNVLADVDGTKGIFEVSGLQKDEATIRRRISLTGADFAWAKAFSDEEGSYYYWNRDTKQTQWEFPAFPKLPPNWEAIPDEESGDFYYHNNITGNVSWEHPSFEELQRNLRDLEVVSERGLDSRPPGVAQVTIWRRSFAENDTSLKAMSEALAALVAKIKGGPVAHRLDDEN